MTMRINDNGIDRDMTADEEKTHLVWLNQTIKEQEVRAEALAIRAVAREALLARLGITAEEAQLLLGGI
jgi:demethoxyubiquinone hydroxylase (CLK1/Coq7/Cat5 family)